MIEFFHIFKQYLKNEYALEDINFTINKGEFVFLTGASGAGKSTLLKLIYKEELPSKGQILIDSVNTNLIPANRLFNLRRNIGIVFQDFKLLLNWTIFDNVAIPLTIRGERRSVIEKRVTNALSLVGLLHRKNYIGSHISGGEQQRVAIARSIVGSPKIIIADEPTGNLDTELSVEILKIFERINANGVTILIATHDKNLIKMFPRRVLQLHKARLIADDKEGGSFDPA